MNRCSILLVQMLTILAGGSSVVFGSLVLTSSPDTATDGELFTMTCTSSQSGGRAWSRDKLYPVLYTQQGNSKVILVSPRLTRDLLGRVTASGSSDGTQNNVTLKINSRIDNGTAWMCRDEIHGETSNTLTIVAVVAPPTTMVLTSLRSTQSTPTGISVSDAVVKSRLSPTTTTVILFTTTTPLFGTEKETSTAASPSPPTTVIVAAVATGVVIIVIVVVVVFIWRNRWNRARKDYHDSSIYTIPSVYEDMVSQYCDLRTHYGNTQGEITHSSFVNTHEETAASCNVNTHYETVPSSYFNIDGETAPSS
ncbi:uncharacterized protein LOC125372138 [Haliotis rufescens]|uniref:uncharacterized protein LOC125372138 n=1 Tax=Haliotis rufescens TaxID=6454 RepID=UPI00201F96F3|nr:uncharacterized protein LOC125372138 [Haliotis rufescens]